ncbi:hypothetical protein [Aliiglaciecola sp. LCG003]|uniref:hypothetical protein n=1 Tax=Aliiglaciecola sp. LCG003 TaxID=3053655 RepID=UPI002573853A|nr:hypothetical protein [Aliiglaciecola sp. LCG003]WJG08604.1 hypothetical protein QR722_14840 [Aliiglaciecola sp. LCG003]
MSNKELKKLVNQIEAQVHAANCSEQIHLALIKAVDYPQPFAYQHNYHITISIVSLLLGGLLLMVPALDVAFLPNWNNPGQGHWIFVWVGLLACSAFIFYLVFSRARQLSSLAKMAFFKDALFDNHIIKKPNPSSREMSRHFAEFLRGNHSREFREFYAGEYVGSEHNFNFSYFHYHYVDKRIETYVTTDSKGRTTVRTRTVYDHFDRYGIIVPFSFYQNIQIIGDSLAQLYPEKYFTGSVQFARKFKVRAGDQFIAAKFLKPAVVVAIEDIAQVLGRLNIELNTTGELCISFTDDNVLSVKQRYDLKQPVEFYQELVANTELRKLQSTLDFIHQLMKHSDSNF